jgi:hypothetical protein
VPGVRPHEQKEELEMTAAELKRKFRNFPSAMLHERIAR